eukprot:6182338-Pleurochrysis_carterae.AAC.2
MRLGSRRCCQKIQLRQHSRKLLFTLREPMSGKSCLFASLVESAAAGCRTVLIETSCVDMLASPADTDAIRIRVKLRLPTASQS